MGRKFHVQVLVLRGLAGQDTNCQEIPHVCFRFSVRQPPPPQWYPPMVPLPPPNASKVPVVTGMEPLEVASLATVFDGSPPPPPNASRVPRVTGTEPLEVAIFVISPILMAETRHPRDCRHFWPNVLSSRVKRTSSHRDRGGSHHDPGHCCRCNTYNIVTFQAYSQSQPFLNKPFEPSNV